VVCGDFKVHIDDVEDANSIKQQRMLDAHDCVQHVDQPTHKVNHTLDLVVTRSDTVVSKLKVGDRNTDHRLIYFRVWTIRPEAEYTERTCRQWSGMDEKQF
jgi:hypothetical protein